MMSIIKNLYNFIRYDIPQGIMNLIKWFPIIWKDRDWDHHFLFEVLRFKLQNMEELFRLYGHSVCSERDAEKIKICVMLLNRIVKNVYSDIVFKYHDKKWGELEITYGESDILGYKTIDIIRVNAKTVEEKEQERKEASRLYKHEDMLLIQDVDYLFKLMNKHILSWWD